MRQIEFRPAFDKRHSDPKQNYGIHGAEMAWYVKGEKGAIQWVVYTNWMLPHVEKELDRKNNGNPDFIHLHCHPQPADLGYHARAPRYDWQEPREDCHVIGGPCYYDGSSLNADPVFVLLVEQGSEEVWKYLEGYYEEIFGEKP